MLLDAETRRRGGSGDHRTLARGRGVILEGGRAAMADLDWSQCPAVESIPGKLSGAWVFRDTRMKVWLILLLVAGAGFGQTPAKKAPAKKAAAAKKEEAAPSKWPVETLTVEGNHNYTREQVLGVAGLKVGQMAGEAGFEGGGGGARPRRAPPRILRGGGQKVGAGRKKKGFGGDFSGAGGGPPLWGAF